tara:strand:- start:1625 stop:3895 length:2271 start_codon:yes stop_codon:yes gene_type:complete
MAEKDRMYAEERRFREEINRLESQRNNLLKERERLDINSEASFSRAQNIRLALSKIEEDIQNSKIKQYQTSLKISEIEKEQLNKTKVTEDLQKKISRHTKDTRDLSSKLNKILTSSKGVVFEQFDISSKTVIQRKTENEQLLKILKNKQSLGKMDSKEIENLEQIVVGNNALNDIERELIEDVMVNSATQMDREEVLNALKDKGLNIDKLSAEAKENILNQVNKIVNASKEMDDNFQKGFEFISQMDDTFQDLIEKSEKFGAVLSNSTLRMSALNALTVGLAVNFGKDVFDAVREVRQELGLSVTESAKLGFQITRNSKLLSVLGGNADEVKNFATEIANEFGNVGAINDKIFKQFVAISASTGLTGENAAKLASSIQSIQSGSLETSLNTIEIFRNLADAEGVSSKLVLEDLAQDTETFAKFARDGGVNIARAAIEAKKLGLELSTVAGIAEKLLDFESSIEDQLNAQILLGRAINLDKARELSLAGDLEGLAKEIRSQVGSQAEFEAMNVVQRKAFAEALGLSVVDLGKMVRGEDTSAMLAEKRAEQQDKSFQLQQKVMKMLELTVPLMTAIQGIQAAILVIEKLKTAQSATQTAHQMRQIVLNRKEIGMGITGAVIEATKTAFKNPAFAILGLAAAGAAAAGIYSLVNSSKARGMAEGGMVGRDGGAVAPSDTVPMMLTPGEVVLNAAQQSNVAGAITNNNVSVDTSTMENLLSGVLKENKKMNTESKLLREQNEVLMNRLIRKQDGMRLANA